MRQKEEYAALLLRNKISLLLDDLCAETTDSALAQDVRALSAQVMEQNPELTFTPKLAKSLMELTQRSIRQYKTAAEPNVAIMEYLDDARAILAGRQIENGGGSMSWLFKWIGGLFKGKEAKRIEELAKKAQAVKDLQGKIDKVYSEMQQLEREMDAYIRSCKGQPQDSIIFRENHRKWVGARQRLASKKQQYDELEKSLTAIDISDIATEHAKALEDIARQAGKAIENPEDLERLAAGAELAQQETGQRVDAVLGIAQAVLAHPSESEMSSDPEFVRLVAEQERRDAIAQMAGLETPAPATGAIDPEFARLVSDAPDEESGADGKVDGDSTKRDSN